MEERITRFIAALRASGVRVSVAESQDAWRAIEHLGIQDREAFRMSLRATLVKDFDSIPTFEDLFPKYFGIATPPMINPQAELSPEQQQMLQQMMQQLLEELAQDLQRLFFGDGAIHLAVVKGPFDWRKDQAVLYRAVTSLAHEFLLDTADAVAHCP